jgi:hypothetical protein
MQPIYFNSYAVYKDPQAGKEHRFTNIDTLVAPNKTNNPNYLATLSFEQLGRIFSFADTVRSNYLMAPYRRSLNNSRTTGNTLVMGALKPQDHGTC